MSLEDKPNIGLLENAIDLHVHVGPDIVERLLDSVLLAEQGRKVGMKGFILKSHFIPTAPVAALTKRLVPEIETIGSLVLNNNVGGLNPSAVETSLKFGGKLIWMPTTSARNHIEYYSRTDHPLLSIEPIEKSIMILKSNGELIEEAFEILNLIAEYDAILATGHLSVQEIKTLVKEATRTGVENIVVTHPLDKLINMRIEDQKEMVKLGAYLEHTLLSTMPIWRVTSPQEIADVVKRIGGEHCILTTDFGQVHHPSPIEGLRFFSRTLLELGVTEASIKKMICENPHKLLGLENND